MYLSEVNNIDAVGKKMESVGDSISGAGKKMMPVTLAITGVGAAAVKTAADFDEGMSKVAAISGATGDDLDALRSKAREMGSKTKFSATEAASAFEYMAMAGWKTEDIETPPSHYGSEVFLLLCRSPPPLMAVLEPDLSLFT